MRCPICDKPLEGPQTDPRDGRIVPCEECQEIIEDALSEFEEMEDSEDV